MAQSRDTRPHGRLCFVQQSYTSLLCLAKPFSQKIIPPHWSRPNVSLLPSRGVNLTVRTKWCRWCLSQWFPTPRRNGPGSSSPRPPHSALIRGPATAFAITSMKTPSNNTPTMPSAHRPSPHVPPDIPPPFVPHPPPPKRHRHPHPPFSPRPFIGRDNHDLPPYP